MLNFSSYSLRPNIVFIVIITLELDFIFYAGTYS